MNGLPWLPPLFPFAGDWQVYEDALFLKFCADFIAAPPSYEGLPVRIKRYPAENGKEASFWHLISEGPVESDRLPDLRRCERIAWPLALVLAAPPAVRRWRNKRGTATRALIALPYFSYVVILDVRQAYFVLWTAYPVTGPRKQADLLRECTAAGG